MTADTSGDVSIAAWQWTMQGRFVLWAARTPVDDAMMAPRIDDEAGSGGVR